MTEKVYRNAVVTIPALDIKRREADVVIRGAGHTYQTHVWWDHYGNLATAQSSRIQSDVDAPDDEVIIETASGGV